MPRIRGMRASVFGVLSAQEQGDLRPQVPTPQPRHRGCTSPQYELREPAERASRSPGAGVPNPGPRSPLPPSPVLRSQPAGPGGAAARYRGPGAAPVLTPWSRRRLRRGRGTAERGRRPPASRRSGPGGRRHPRRGCGMRRDVGTAPVLPPPSRTAPSAGRAPPLPPPIIRPRGAPGFHLLLGLPGGSLPATAATHHPASGVPGAAGGSRSGSWLCSAGCGAGWRGCIHSPSMNAAPVSA